MFLFLLYFKNFKLLGGMDNALLLFVPIAPNNVPDIN